MSNIKDFFSSNKKHLICFLILFAVGIIVGIIFTINTTGEEFERIPRSEIQFGSIKVFFFASLFLLIGYAVVLISCYGSKIVFLSVTTFLALGIIFGKYMCLLIACYAAIGLLNLFLIYLPFFVLSLICLLIGASCAISAPRCEASRCSKLKPSFVVLIKLYCVNVLINFVIFVIIGTMVDVIVVVL